MIQDKGCFAPVIFSPLHHGTMALFFMILLTSSVIFAGPEETAKLVVTGIQNGNAGEVSKYFNVMVDLSVPGYDDTYSKAQAGQILRDFFLKYPVKSFKINKEGSSNDGSRYSIGELQTGQITFRVYFLIKPVGAQNLIQQLQIQEKN